MKRESDTRIEYAIYINRHIFAYQTHLSFVVHSEFKPTTIVIYLIYKCI